MDNLLHTLCETLNHAGMKKSPPRSVRRESSQRGVIVMHLRGTLTLSDASAATFASQPLEEATLLTFLQNNFNNVADS